MKALPQRPAALIIMDGFGINPTEVGNAIAAANTPNLDRLMNTWPTTQIRTSGMDVGLPDGQMGNSEVGHTNIGAGRIVYQDLTRITKSIEDGDFFSNPALVGAVKNCQEKNSALHLMGLVSPGGVHSHNTHLYALLKLAAEQGLEKVYVHCLLDGRDVPPNSAQGYLAELEEQMKIIGTGQIATIMGRYYAMDRDNRWERVEKAYLAITAGIGDHFETTDEAIASSYANEVYDEFVIPAVIGPAGQPTAILESGDSFIFFNFRPDRAREITRALKQADFTGFERQKICDPLYYVTFTQYDAQFVDFEDLHVAYGPESLDDTFGEYISKLGYTQLRIAETEKYAHVTFFFNGGVEAQYPGEDRALIPSPKVPTYDLMPEMSQPGVTEECLKRIAGDRYDVIILNFANCDMVGHTGVFEAAVAAVEAVDDGIGRITDAILAKGGVALITADHGNAEQMIDPETGGPFTAHTTFPVRLIGAGIRDAELAEGRLADLTPTLLDLMGLEKPAAMSGRSLLIRNRQG
jgi:2,3-bisphosphoglycerate-independent phosphoglycerate mutase